MEATRRKPTQGGEVSTYGGDRVHNHWFLLYFCHDRNNWLTKISKGAVHLGVVRYYFVKATTTIDAELPFKLLIKLSN